MARIALLNLLFWFLSLSMILRKKMTGDEGEAEEPNGSDKSL
jgi:hypothetical protein